MKSSGNKEDTEYGKGGNLDIIFELLFFVSNTKNHVQVQPGVPALSVFSLLGSNLSKRKKDLTFPLHPDC